MKKEEIERFLLFFVFFHVLLGLLLSHVHPKYFSGNYVVEDGLIEWLTVDALLMSAFFLLFRAWKVRLSRGKLFLVGLLFGGAVFIFGAGEEISWGQRLFNVQSNEFFAANNSQGETNLHNLVVGGKKINKLIFGLGLGVAIASYLLLLPLLYRRYESVKLWVATLAIPVPRNLHLISYLILFGLVQLIPTGKRGEILEFGGVFIFFMILLFPLNESFSVAVAEKDQVK